MLSRQAFLAAKMAFAPVGSSSSESGSSSSESGSGSESEDASPSTDLRPTSLALSPEDNNNNVVRQRDRQLEKLDDLTMEDLRALLEHEKVQRFARIVEWPEDVIDSYVQVCMYVCMHKDTHTWSCAFWRICMCIHTVRANSGVA